MTAAPAEINRERLNRLGTAVADLMEGQSRQGRDILAALARLDERLDRIESRLASVEREVRSNSSEQALLANRVEEAFSRAFRTNMRLDEIEDAGAGLAP